MSKNKTDRENQLAEVLDDAGILAPLMNVMVEQAEAEAKPTNFVRKPSAAREYLRQFFYSLLFLFCRLAAKIRAKDSAEKPIQFISGAAAEHKFLTKAYPPGGVSRLAMRTWS